MVAAGQLELARPRVSIASCGVGNQRESVGRSFRKVRAETPEFGVRRVTNESAMKTSFYVTYVSLGELLLGVLLSRGWHALLEEGRAVVFQCPQLTQLNSLNKTRSC